MVIKRVYNNNVVLAEDSQGNEVVLLGKGIAFGLSKGDTIPKHAIEKKFEFTGDTNFKFKELVKNISVDIIRLSDEIISLVKETITMPISDGIYVTLTDHIVNLTERIRMGISFDNSLLWNVKQLYPKEYQIGLQAVNLINERLHLKVGKEEASFIALHIINAEINTEMTDLYEVTSLVSEINNIVQNYFPKINVSDYTYERFMIHCRLFALNIIKHTGLTTVSEKNEKTLDLLKNQYQLQTECLNGISDYIASKCSYQVSQDEALYLMLHLIKLTG